MLVSDSRLLRLCEKSGVLRSLPPATAPDSHFYSPQSSAPLQKMNSIIPHGADGAVHQLGRRASSPGDEGSPRPPAARPGLSRDSPSSLGARPAAPPSSLGLEGPPPPCPASPGVHGVTRAQEALGARCRQASPGVVGSECPPSSQPALGTVTVPGGPVRGLCPHR